MLFRGRASSVFEVGALSDLDNVSVGVADVAANLAVLGDRRREELGTPTFPQFVARLNIRNAEIHKTVDVIRVGDAERYRRLTGGSASGPCRQCVSVALGSSSQRMRDNSVI